MRAAFYKSQILNGVGFTDTGFAENYKAMLSIGVQERDYSPDSGCIATTSIPAPHAGKYPAEPGIWTLTAPSGKYWQGSSPIKAIAAESRERIPAHIALDRILAYAAPTPLGAEIDRLRAALRRMLFLHDNFTRWEAQRKMYEEFPELKHQIDPAGKALNLE